jgi:glycosyltransferase involved in cell wall biosynthesis
MAEAINLVIVVPCYNEQEVLPDASARLAAKRAQLIKDGLISEASRIAFVDDGSRDSTKIE